jgi:putative SOS response-associated peptidase YedK
MASYRRQIPVVALMVACSVMSYFDRPILSIAGLWDEWNDKETGESLKSCSMIITAPNKFVGQIHDRMPMLLSEEQFEPWLSAEAGTEILLPAPENAVRMRKVSRRVNSSRADDTDPTLIGAVAA